jgi:hypothetical protein
MRTLPMTLAHTLALCLLALVSLGFSSGSCQKQPDAAELRKTPEFGDCLNGKSLDTNSNCAEYCATRNKACQNFGCNHPQEKGSRYGALAYGGEYCTGAPVRAFQCYEAFSGEPAVRCCCVYQQQ